MNREVCITCAEYCAKKGPNHHVIFLVDEIGQYIADDKDYAQSRQKPWNSLQR